MINGLLVRCKALTSLGLASVSQNKSQRAARSRRGRRNNMKQAGMAPARRRGTLGNLAGHQRGEAADPMESWSPGRHARQPCRLPWVELEQNIAAGALSHGGHRFALVQSSGGTGSTRSAIYIGDVGGDVQPRPATSRDGAQSIGRLPWRRLPEQNHWSGGDSRSKHPPPQLRGTEFDRNHART